MSRLILIEGLPGVGKSTLAKLSKTILDELNIENQLFSEGDLDHPADYDQVTFFSHQEYMSLEDNYKNYGHLLNKIAHRTDKGMFIPYGKYREEIPKQLLAVLMKKDIYELSFDLYKGLILDRWKAFSKNAKEDCTYIFECCFLQNPITVGMIRDNQPEGRIVNYINEITKIIEPLNPLLIYIHQEDVEKSFNRVVSVRPVEWYTGFMDYYTLQGYGKDNHLTGLDGTLDILKARKELEYKIIEELELEKNLINNTHYNTEYNKSILKELLRNYLEFERRN